MAKLKGPLFSLGASQQLGKVIVYFPWKGLNLAREYVVPANPKTTGQVTQRGHLTAAVAAVHAVQANATHPLLPIDVSAYALWASVVQAATTWFNQAVRCWVDQLIAGLTGYLWSGAVNTPGASNLGVEIYDTIGTVTAGNFKYGTSKTALINSMAATVLTPKFSATIAGLTTGVKYFWQLVPTAPAGAVGAKSGIYYGVAG